MNPGRNELDVFRFLYEVKQEQIDPLRLQQILIEHQMRAHTLAMQQSVEDESDHGTVDTSYFKEEEEGACGYDAFPPKVVCQYGPNEKMPTGLSVDSMETDYFNNFASSSRNFPSSNPSQSPNVQEPQPTDASGPTEQKNDTRPVDAAEFLKIMQQKPLELKEQEEPVNFYLTHTPKISNWQGSSVYNNMPESVMSEYDKMLKEGHDLKVSVIKAMNQEFPVSYDYNPHKSRIRVDYNDERVAHVRIKNNVASRRSRQRKKFQQQAIQWSVDYDNDENVLLEMEEKWLRQTIEDLEKKALAKGGVEVVDKLMKLRAECGFK